MCSITNTNAQANQKSSVEKTKVDEAFNSTTKSLECISVVQMNHTKVKKEDWFRRSVSVGEMGSTLLEIDIESRRDMESAQDYDSHTIQLQYSGTIDESSVIQNENCVDDGTRVRHSLLRQDPSKKESNKLPGHRRTDSDSDGRGKTKSR